MICDLDCTLNGRNTGGAPLNYAGGGALRSVSGTILQILGDTYLVIKLRFHMVSFNTEASVTGVCLFHESINWHVRGET